MTGMAVGGTVGQNIARTIEQLALRFREGIEESIERREISTRTTRSTLPFFPQGCCDIASDLLAQYLLENDIITQCNYGEYDYYEYEIKYPHSWLETRDGYVIDITADQFCNKPGFSGYALLPCYVSKNRSFYDLFHEQRRNDSDFCGLDAYPENYQKIIKPLYRVIIQHIT